MLLAELYCTAGKYGPAFEDLFFSVLEQVMLADGVIDTAELYYLLKMLYSDREIRPRERELLLRLRSLSDLSPEMEPLCDEALFGPSDPVERRQKLGCREGDLARY